MFSPKKIILLTSLLCLSFSLSLSQAIELENLDLIHAQGCKGCHKINESGGAFGPSLDGIGNRLLRKQIRQKIFYPKKNNPISKMPDSLHLTLQEKNILTDDIARLR
jgi:hypothetical protein